MNKKNKTFSYIYVTRDYERFSFIDGNRAIRPNHVEKLCNSFRETQLPVPLVVDKHHRIYDGQNRFMALKSLELPIYYQVVDKMTLRMLQLLNSNSSNWTTAQYCHSYCELGFAEYYKYRSFKRKYKFGVRVCLGLLSGNLNSKHEQIFADGKFVCSDYQNAIMKAEMLTELKPYVDFYKKREFVSAMNTLFKNKIYDHNRFVRKLKKRSSKLTDQTTPKDFLRTIEEIYNWNELVKNKVRLFTY